MSTIQPASDLESTLYAIAYDIIKKHLRDHADDLKTDDLDTPEKIASAIFRTVAALKKRRV
jgi:hypothetical protein